MSPKRISLLQGITNQPLEVIPYHLRNLRREQISPADSAVAFEQEMAGKLDEAEAQVDEAVKMAKNPYAETSLQAVTNLLNLATDPIIPVPDRTPGKSHESIVHAHLINPGYGSCYNRRVGFLIGLELAQDKLSGMKQLMHKRKADLAKLLLIREGLVGRIFEVVESSGDRYAPEIQGLGGAVVRAQHMLQKNQEGDREAKAVEASVENLKRRAAEMAHDNAETVRVAKRLKAHVDAGGILITDHPVDFDLREGLMATNMRAAMASRTGAMAAYVEKECRALEHYKLKLREADARYKDLCRAHMLIYLELKREGWENVPRIYRRPGHWFA